MNDRPVARHARMGPSLRGTSPPFTPTGLGSHAASFAPANAESSFEQRERHRGLLVPIQVDPAKALELLPEPLEANDHTATAFVLLSEVQRAEPTDALVESSPQVVNWHQAAFLIPCSVGGTRAAFVWNQYTEIEHDAGILLGIYRGVVGKAAEFSKIFPFAGQPLNRSIGEGAVTRMLVSRMGERLVSCTFRAQQVADGDALAAELRSSGLFNPIGVRFFPDWSNPGGPPLVHDLVSWDVAESAAVREAWLGEADLQIEAAPDEELSLLEPTATLPAHFVNLELTHRASQAQVVHAYVERTIESGRVSAQVRSEMGRGLTGVSPPFTRAGRAAFARSTDLGGDEKEGEGVQAGHVGLLLRWRANRANAEAFVPAPLEAAPNTDEIYLFLNQTQTGLNIHQAGGQRGLEHLERLNPSHVNWHEALFMIPCLCDGERGVFVTHLYKDIDHGVVLGVYDGFATKLATFHETFPFPAVGQSVGSAGSASMVVSRLDQRLVTASFVAERELTEAEIAEEIEIDELLNDIGVRFFPDYTQPGGPPLVHDIVMWDMAGGGIPRAWAGETQLTLSTSDDEELHLLEPIEMLPSHFIHLEYEAGPGGCRVIHDYVAEPLPANEA